MGHSKLERRVVVVDDSRTIQAILDNAFSSRSDFHVIGFAADARTAAEMIRRLMPDIVTIDLCMPYIDGEALLGMIADLTRVRKVVVSDKAVTNRLLTARLLDAGASLCLAKSELVEQPISFFKKINAAADAIDGGKRIDQGVPGTTSRRALRPSLAWSPTALHPFPVPADEHRRLAVASRKGLFNAVRESPFDTITKNLARLTGFPVALLTFIDRDTQWVKSSYGLDVESMPRAQAFCSYTIAQGGVFTVANTATDERFAANPLVVGAPHIRSYVGYPVVTADDVAVGALCVIDTSVRTLSRHGHDQLAAMAEVVAEMIDLRPAMAA